MVSNIKLNHISYDWNDIEVYIIGDISLGGSSSFGSYTPSGVSSINYSTDHNVEYEYSRTGFPIGRKYGNYVSTANITLDYYELKSINNRFFGLIQGIKPIDIKIIYNKGKHTYIDTLYGCTINYPTNVGGSQNELGLEATIELNPVWINYGNALLK